MAIPSGRSPLRVATVEDAMVTTAALHPPTTTIAEARAALEDPHRHLLLIVSGSRLLGTLGREDLGDPGVRSDPAAEERVALVAARLSGRTARAHEPLAAVHAAMLAARQRRRAVVDERGALLGLLCLKANGAGFCSDEGVAARSRPRMVR